jgi:hypothetical protein
MSIDVGRGRDVCVVHRHGDLEDGHAAVEKERSKGIAVIIKPIALYPEFSVILAESSHHSVDLFV